jgi:hypothetical protein
MSWKQVVVVIAILVLISCHATPAPPVPPPPQTTYTCIGAGTVVIRQMISFGVDASGNPEIAPTDDFQPHSCGCSDGVVRWGKWCQQ